MVSIGPTPEEDAIIGKHFTYLEQLTKGGVILLAGRTLNKDYSNFGTIIFRSSSEQAARQIMESDPAVKHRIMRAELYPYRIALLGDLANISE
jgi:uncharacterized protein YciI